MEDTIASAIGLTGVTVGAPHTDEDSSASAGITAGVLRVRSSNSPSTQPGASERTLTVGMRLAFSPLSLPGFSDYQATYSHFRIIKARLYVSRTVGDNDGALYNYLVVGSRPFAATSAGTQANSATLVPPQEEKALRQTKWQKVHYPNTTTQRVSIGFYPYTMILPVSQQQ